MFVARHVQITQNKNFAISLCYLSELFFFNWNWLHARLNSHYEAWSYKKKKHKKRLQDTENLFRKNLDEVEFLNGDKYESLLQIYTMILMLVVKHSQSSRNSKFAISLKYLKKEFKDEVDFLHADTHQCFLQVDFNTVGIKVSLQVDTIIIDGHDQAFSKCSK